MAITLDISNIQVPNQPSSNTQITPTAGEGFISTHKPILVHNTHVRRVFYKIASGQLNAVFLDGEGFGLRLEWRGQYLSITPGVVNATMPDETMYISHATFWRQEEERKKMRAEQERKKKVELVEKNSSNMIQEAEDDEII